MAETSAIEWTDATWNPIVGCSLVSPACTNCYAMAMAARLERMSAKAARGAYDSNVAAAHYVGTTTFVKNKNVWSGVVNRAPDKVLLKPLRWKKGRRIFVNSMSDLFHESVPDEWIDQVFAVMALAPHHTFQVLTKRPARMRDYFEARREGDPWAEAADAISDMLGMEDSVIVLEPKDIPLPNVWLGVTAEDQQRADERIPELLATPAAVRFASCEPLLGAIDLRRWMFDWGCESCGYGGHATLDHCPNCGWVGEGPTIQCASGDCPGDCPECGEALSDYYACPECKATNDGGFGPTLSGDRRGYIDWIIAGGESGPGARPSHPDWFRGLRDQCAAAGVPFHFKQWGEWLPDKMLENVARRGLVMKADGSRLTEADIPAIARGSFNFRGYQHFSCVGKKHAGRLLDGRQHNEFPEARR